MSAFSKATSGYISPPTGLIELYLGRHASDADIKHQKSITRASTSTEHNKTERRLLTMTSPKRLFSPPPDLQARVVDPLGSLLSSLLSRRTERWRSSRLCNRYGPPLPYTEVVGSTTAWLFLGTWQPATQSTRLHTPYRRRGCWLPFEEGAVA